MCLAFCDQFRDCYDPFHLGCGYHLDLLLVGALIFVNSIFGLPWFVAATVLSITYVQSLRLESECAAPGKRSRTKALYD